jgi:cytochrome b561
LFFDLLGVVRPPQIGEGPPPWATPATPSVFLGFYIFLFLIIIIFIFFKFIKNLQIFLSGKRYHFVQNGTVFHYSTQNYRMEAGSSNGAHVEF